MTSLIEAVQDGSADLVIHYLKAGFDPNACTRLGLSSLHLAAVHDRAELVSHIIKSGGNVNKLTGWGSSALHLAAHKGSTLIVKQLIEFRADINIRDENNDTPLHLACAEGHIDVIRELLTAGAETNIPNNAGNTAFDESPTPEVSAEFLQIATPPSSQPLPPLMEGSQPLLQQTEFVPDYEVPTNESFSSIINEFLLTGEKVNLSRDHLVQSYSDTKSMFEAQKFSILNLKNDTLDLNNIPNLPEGANLLNSVDLLQPSCSLSKMLNFENDNITGNSIDSSVYRETYELFQQLKKPYTPPLPSYTRPTPHPSYIHPTPNMHPSYTTPLLSYPSSSLSAGEHLSKQSEISDGSCLARCSLSEETHKPCNQVSDLVSCLSPLLSNSPVSHLIEVMENIARGLLPPWPDESANICSTGEGEWVYGEDYVLVSNTPLNVQNVQDREGSCSLVFKVLHQQFGPLVLKMMVNLLNELEHDVGQSGTVFLRKQFSAEHAVPVALPYHPNIVQMLHSYNGSTTPFKRYLPLLIPPGLDVDIDMASRTHFLVMREYPLSLRNFVNKVVELKVKQGESSWDRVTAELHLFLLLLLQCLFALQHLKRNKVAHRDIKLDNLMIRHSGQIILIDFGWAVSFNHPDGTPVIATDKIDIIAGNPAAWSPEISSHHHNFTCPVPFSSIYDKSDVHTLGKMFLSVFQVLGFIDDSELPICPPNLSHIPSLVDSISLLQEITHQSPAQRISAVEAMTSLGQLLFFNNPSTPQEVVSQYITTSLLDSSSHSASITEIETLPILSQLNSVVRKQFIATVEPRALIS